MRKMFLVATLAFFLLPVMAQETNTAWWPAIKVEKKLTKKMSLTLEHETRYFTDLGEIDRFATALEGDYSITKRWDVALAYVWIYNHNIKEDSYANRNRYYFYIRYKQKIGNWSFYIREKFQSTYEDSDAENVKYSPKNVLRSKAEVAYKIKSISLTPYINGQIRNRLNHPTENKIDRYRWSLGAEYKFNKQFGVDFYYQRQGELNVKKPDKINIIGTTLKIKI